MADIESLMGSGNAALASLAIMGNPTALTATGTAQGTAAAIASSTVNVTAATSQTGVILPSGALGSVFGDTVKILNVSGTTAIVYPFGSETVNNGSSVSLPQYKMVILVRVNATQWLYIITP